ncbi:D-alanyl-D-alanine carboxypeptidase family protein [Macrococcoides canis]|uniref:D-alanyl-D-alanine carboxypeptidase family protein n=1 Tax=Macrococcoides canis TaxID=1855823 RepID=A0AAE7C0M8_9STAP|nr:M15 family metallopeptidase [Macrococcus canis]QIH79046.1 D-alanyl-D-alanine carboxypeptidase family protein [Macrococcus canis]QUR95016.1 D-alanyl-D-alanine carboxypeptidase family protein [Macrococcus canis]UTH02014.1 M15 family metallopeptidase [Macrococcus canis]UTH06438.1 M15 family metallopeptidase [Macrococcus canis]UTH08781.1 M15 family metallopeptidase [Macrococcus canis]
MKKLLIIIILCLVACSNEQVVTQKNTYVAPPKYERITRSGVTYVNDILIVNKKIGLPADFNPGENRYARMKLNQMIKDAKSDKQSLVVRSGYRSYQMQDKLYKAYKAQDANADTYSARPGHSEHQTGLAFDIGSVESARDFTISFGDTTEGEWLAQNAHKYGFIIRYPEGKTHITGYQYEPWHVRYVGVKIAQEIFNKKITLEEYLGLYPKDQTVE